MPFVRHELGRALRIKRIPELHVHLDDTAERGTRVLQLLDELEAGATPDGDAAVGESLPTPVAARCPTRATCRRAAIGGAAGARPARADVAPERRRRAATEAARANPAMTVDLAPVLGAVPDVVVERLRGARACWRSATRTRTPTRSARRSRSSASSRRSAARADAVCTDRPRRYTTSCRASSGSGPTRTRTPPTTCSSSPTAARSSGSGPSAIATRSCSRGCRGSIIDHHASNDAAGRGDWIDPQAAATCEMVALLAARLGVPLDADDGALATTSWPASSWTPRRSPTQRHAPDARGSALRSSRPARRCRTSRAGCTASKPEAQLRLFGRILDRLESARRRPDRVVDADRRGRRRDGRRARALGGHHRPPRPRPRRPRSRSCSRRPAAATRDQRPDASRAAWTRRS